MSENPPAPVPERPRRGRGRPPATDRRRQIEDAALEEFAEHGFRNSSLAAVAQRVGLSQQGLLHHFPNKEALLVAVLARRDAVDTADFGGLRDIDRLTGLAERNTERPGVVRLHALLTAEAVTDDHPAGPFFRARYEELRTRVAEAVRESEHEEAPAPQPTPEETAALLVAAMDGLQLQWLHDPEAVDMPALLGLLTRVLYAHRGGAEQG
ncbi:TetR/AcrR family transcriptional regulator [Nocardiopsis sp. HNM0947]|uniref:TetR/AcrR family transcriptional regulator n=1 Tax=Nocardiopsis coralli TaxID=2772213 RepID=A0ABR9P6I8_9ACTN|nr:TetR/AcrR family transcriptional regulator [Nocardiopsis coralli]MBE2999432.1 TetR/AcrR family transcriptional regulator [Nocardiopsis coralli]